MAKNDSDGGLGVTEDPESQPRKKKPKKQKELPGVVDEINHFPDITRAARRLLELRADWQELGGKIERANGRTLLLMHEHGITHYIGGGLRLEIVPTKEKLKIREAGEEVESD